MAFTLVAFAFIGLGLVIAMMADTVPAVQALGQCIFLPMLIIGGVAVPLASLPDWAQRLSGFFPGRYAVETLQACVTGTGLGAARFSALALVVIGLAGCVAGAKMFRWDSAQRFATAPGKGWVAVALAAWVAVGVMAETQGRRVPRTAATEVAGTCQCRTGGRAVLSSPRYPATDRRRSGGAHDGARRRPDGCAHWQGTCGDGAPHLNCTERETQAVGAGSSGLSSRTRCDAGHEPAENWRAVTLADVERDLIFTRLPPDSGVVTPIAPLAEEPDETTLAQLDKMRAALADWKPGKVPDPVQRVRNFLYVAAVPDVFQMQELERFVPLIVYERIQEDIPKEDLIKILYWIATHPFDGDDKAVDELRPLGLFNGPADMEQTRGRLSVYAVKLLGRITGHIKPE